MCNCKSSPNIGTTSISNSGSLLNSPTDGNTVYSSLKNSNSYRDVFDLNGSDVLDLDTALTQPDSMFNYVDVLKQGTITPDQIGKFHNLGLDFVMNYPDFKKYDDYTQLRIIASIMRNIGVTDNDLPFDEMYIQFKKYGPKANTNAFSLLQRLYTDSLVNSLQYRYLNTALNILKINFNNSNSPRLININAVKVQINNLISVVKNDINLSIKDNFNLITSLSVLKYSVEYWNNYSVNEANSAWSLGSSTSQGLHSSDFAQHQNIPCCGPGIGLPCSNAYPCNYYGGGNGNVNNLSAACRACINQHIVNICFTDSIAGIIGVIFGGGVLSIFVSIAFAVLFSWSEVDNLCPVQCGTSI